MMLILHQIISQNNKIKKILITRSLHNLWSYNIENFSSISGMAKMMILHIQIIHLTEAMEVDFPALFNTSFTIIGNPTKGFSNNS